MIRVCILQGIGELHINSISNTLANNKNIALKHVANWVPVGFSKKYLKKLANLLGKDWEVIKAKEKKFNNLTDNQIINLPSIFILSKFLNYLSKVGLVTQEFSYYVSYYCYGVLAMKNIPNCDIVHFRSGSLGVRNIRKLKSKGIKTIADFSTPHHASFVEKLNTLYTKYNLKPDLNPSSVFWSRVFDELKEVDIILVNSKFVMESLIQNGYKKENIVVIYLGVNLFNNSYNNFNVSNVLTGFTEVFTLVFSGVFFLRKGANIIIDALNILNRKGRKVLFNVYGSLEEFNKIKQHFEIPENLLLHGFVDFNDLMKALAHSNVFVFPTYLDGASKSVIEAMSLGLPVITTLESGCPIISGDNGILVESGNVEQLVESIELLMDDMELRTRIGINAKNYVKENLTWEIYTENLIELYSNTIALN